MESSPTGSLARSTFAPLHTFTTIPDDEPAVAVAFVLDPLAPIEAVIVVDVIFLFSLDFFVVVLVGDFAVATETAAPVSSKATTEASIATSIFHPGCRDKRGRKSSELIMVVVLPSAIRDRSELRKFFLSFRCGVYWCVVRLIHSRNARVECAHCIGDSDCGF
jgi:hypothetical protein